MSHPLFGRHFATGDLKLAAALLTHGVPLDETRGGIRKVKGSGRDYQSFQFGPTSFDEEYKTEQLMAAWAAGEAAARCDPRAGMSWISRYELNLRALRKVVREQQEQILLRRGNQLALVDPTAPQDQQDVFLQKIGI